MNEDELDVGYRGSEAPPPTTNGSAMHVLWVSAHPDERSLNAELRDAGYDAVRDAGHHLDVSDLYSMGWKAALDRDDLGGHAHLPPEISRATKQAFEAGTLAADVREEQEKLRRADAVVLQFPLWWYSVPAIMKGWIDRVFSKGFAYGITDPAQPGRTFRYGDGPLQGKRAQVITTAGSPAAALGPRGINGQIDQVLFPLLHGTLWYVGMTVLPPIAIDSADRMDATELETARQVVRERVGTLWDVEPIAYRHQNRGDYDEDLVLRPDLAPGEEGIGVHVASPQEHRLRVSARRAG
jgi:NAD(P)H dehydrogenase (quinone)